MTFKGDKVIFKQQMRREAAYSVKYKKAFVYITNNFDLTAKGIAAIYANRWQIELLQKIKTKFPAYLLFW